MKGINKKGFFGLNLYSRHFFLEFTSFFVIEVVGSWNPDDRASSPIGEPNSKDRYDWWENLSSLNTTCVEPMWDRIIPYPLRNRTAHDIHSGWLTLWIAFTPNPPLGHRVALL